MTDPIKAAREALVRIADGSSCKTTNPGAVAVYGLTRSEVHNIARGALDAIESAPNDKHLLEIIKSAFIEGRYYDGFDKPPEERASVILTSLRPYLRQPEQLPTDSVIEDYAAIKQERDALMDKLRLTDLPAEGVRTKLDEWQAAYAALFNQLQEVCASKRESVALTDQQRMALWKELFAHAVTIPLSVSSTRRSGQNGLRNVEEVVCSFLSAIEKRHTILPKNQDDVIEGGKS